jgi:MOSC domain-containing protein YiiM
MAYVLSVNAGSARTTSISSVGATAIDKRPVAGRVAVSAPGPRGVGRSGLAGDTTCDVRHHGGDDQALYAFAREDLDRWEAELDRALACGVFGENLTTVGIDPTEARIGERWRVGPSALLEVSMARIPCRTFASWLDEQGWVRRFTERAAPGAYLRVLAAGDIGAGDEIHVVERPDHDTSIGVVFRALTREPDLLPRLLDVPLPQHVKDHAARRLRDPNTAADF